MVSLCFFPFQTGIQFACFGKMQDTFRRQIQIIERVPFAQGYTK